MNVYVFDSDSQSFFAHLSVEKRLLFTLVRKHERCHDGLSNSNCELLFYAKNLIQWLSIFSPVGNEQ